jgi:hypothetical protein
MRTRIVTAALAATLCLSLSACSSYSAEDCKKAITDSSTKTSRPKECEDLSQKDYDVVLTNWIMQKTFSEMSKEERDTLDYYDDGSINGSLDD